jgi:CubicO group peptidase (beta-lactamase class C family)
LTTIVLLAVACGAPPQAWTAAPVPPNADRLAAFEALVRQQMAVDRTTGLSLAFQINDVVWARGFGLSDVENEVPMTAESSYRLASITKPMTASAILQLVEQGKIDLDAEIQTYVPFFPRKQWPVTVRQLLGHLGGVTHYKNRDVELHIKEHKSTREAIAIFQEYDLVVEPGTQYRYSTYGYNLLGAAIEGVSGQTYGDYMRDHIWAPLDMTDTRMDDPVQVIPRRVRGYRLIQNRVANSEFVDISSRFAGGGTRTTVLDLLKFARGYQEGKVVSPASVGQMTSAMSTREGHATYYGMGWDILPMNGHYMTSHSGGQNETRTFLFSIPGRRCAMALATNFESADIYVYATMLARVVLDEIWDRSGGTATYVGDAVSAGRLAAMRQAFDFGLFHYEKAGEPLVQDAGKLQQAFAYFNACADHKALRSERQAVLDKIEAGRWPSTGEALTAVGSFMASRLHGRFGPEGLDDYHRTSAVPFFADYVQLYRRDQGIPKELRFSSEVEKQVQRWNEDWKRTCTSETRNLTIAPFTDLDGLQRSMQQVFARRSIYPDFTEALASTSWQLLAAGDAQRSLRAASLSYDFYPESPMACTALALASLCDGDSAQARTLLHKAVTLGDEDITGAGTLNSRAYDLAAIGHVDASIGLLRIATGLYPRQANLYDSLGEMWTRKGRKEEAIAAYRQALDIDPKLEATRKALAELETATAR